MNQNNATLIFNDWLDNIESLTDKDYRDIISAIRNYQNNGTFPEGLSETAKIAWNFMMCDMKRRD